MDIQFEIESTKRAIESIEARDTFFYTPGAKSIILDSLKRKLEKLNAEVAA